jgi:hypothetical protein
MSYKAGLNDDMEVMNVDEVTRSKLLATVDDIPSRQKYLDFLIANINRLDETYTYLVQTMSVIGVTNLNEFQKYMLLRIYVTYNLPFILHGVSTDTW